MQKLLLIALFSAGLLFGTSRAEAQHVYVNVRPTAHAVKRPPAPSHAHVWVGSEWSQSGNGYTEVAGHWEVPPHGHHTWVAGHWVKERRGNYWVAGHWS
jgi:hypothetical protein